jgi:hypothetical protein
LHPIQLLCVKGVYSLIHIILMFFIWSGNHKFYIQFLRLLALQSFRITLYNNIIFKKLFKKLVICVSRPKSVRVCVFWPRRSQENKGTFWQRCTLNFLEDRTNYKAKDIIGKITNNLFCIYLFQIDTFIITY